ATNRWAEGHDERGFALAAAFPTRVSPRMPEYALLEETLVANGHASSCLALLPSGRRIVGISSRPRTTLPQEPGEGGDHEKPRDDELRQARLGGRMEVGATEEDDEAVREGKARADEACDHE